MKPLRNGISLLLCSRPRQVLLCVAGKARTHTQDAVLEKLPTGEALWVFEGLWHANVRSLRLFAHQIGLATGVLMKSDHKLWEEITIRIERGDLWMFRAASTGNSSAAHAVKRTGRSVDRVLELRSLQARRVAEPARVGSQATASRARLNVSPSPSTPPARKPSAPIK